MGTHLVVLDPSIPARSLRYGLLNYISQHKPVDLVMLMPLRMLPGQSLEECRQASYADLESVIPQLTRMRLPVIDALVGDALPRKAIAHEISRGGRTYDGVLLAAPAPAVLRMLQVDPASQLERRLGIPVKYIDPDRSGELFTMTAGLALIR